MLVAVGGGIAFSAALHEEIVPAGTVGGRGADDSRRDFHFHFRGARPCECTAGAAHHLHGEQFGMRPVIADGLDVHHDIVADEGVAEIVVGILLRAWC